MGCRTEAALAFESFGSKTDRREKCLVVPRAGSPFRTYY